MRWACTDVRSHYCHILQRFSNNAACRHHPKKRGVKIKVARGNAERWTWTSIALQILSHSVGTDGALMLPSSICWVNEVWDSITLNLPLLPWSNTHLNQSTQRAFWSQRNGLWRAKVDEQRGRDDAAEIITPLRLCGINPDLNATQRRRRHCSSTSC